MMKKIGLTAFCILASAFCMAQSKINFRDLSLNEALKAAEAENKLVFFDAYAVWCGPCKYMDNNIFTQDEVGAFINEHFVSIKCDMEQGEGPALLQRYQISSYPTYLILKTDGSLQHKVIGGSPTAEEFIAKMKQGLDPEKATGLLKEQYDAGNRDIEFLTKYVKALLEERDMQQAYNVSQALLGMLSDEEKTSADYWFIYESPILAPVGAPFFDYIVKNKEAFEASVGKEAVDKKIYTSVEKQYVDAVIGRPNVSPEAVLEVQEYLAPYEFEGKERLNSYAKIVAAKQAGMIDPMLDGLIELAPQMTEKELNQIYFGTAFYIRQRADEEQRVRLEDFSNRLVDMVDEGTFKNALQRFIKTELGKTMTTGVRNK